MFRHFVFAAAVLAFFFISAAAFAADNAPAQKPEGIIGTIMDVEGTATVTPAGGAAKPLALKDSIHMNDVIATSAKSRVLVLFIDNTQFTLSENTKLTVNQYVFDPDNNANNKAHYNVLEGTFQYLSGLIAKKKDPDVNIDTVYGTIGIRGTKLWGGHIDNAYGIHVEEGAISVKNDGGQVFVNKGQGTALKSRREPPQKAAPWPVKELAFIAQTVLLGNESEVLQRIAGFQGQQKLLQGQFKQFLKFGPGNMKNLVPGNLPVPGNNNLPLPGNNKGKQRSKNPFGGLPGMPSIPGGF